jgi:hypothetical protein
MCMLIREAADRMWHTSSPIKKKFKRTVSTRMIMCTVFWYRKGVLLVEFLPQGSTNNAGVYCDTLRNCVVRSRTSDVACLLGVLWCFMTMPDHPLPPQRKILSRYLAENNSIIALQPRLSAKWFSCVPASENLFLSDQRFHDDNEVKEAVNTCFASQAASFYDAGIQKLVPRYKCHNNGGNYVEK